MDPVLLTELFEAAYSGRLDIVKFMLKHQQVPVDTVDSLQVCKRLTLVQDRAGSRDRDMPTMRALNSSPPFWNDSDLPEIAFCWAICMRDRIHRA